jgi:hypothetical protein
MEFEMRANINDENMDSDIENELSTRFGRGNSEVKVDKTGMIQVCMCMYVCDLDVENLVQVDKTGTI